MYIHGYACIITVMWGLIFSRKISRQEITGSHDIFSFSFRNLHTDLNSGCTSLYSHQWCRILFTSSLAFVVYWVIDNSHSYSSKVESQCFSLHFSAYQRCWMCFNIFIGHLCILFKQPIFWLSLLFGWNLFKILYSRH